ncbi:MAG: phosphatidylglycerophosphatase A [Hydrotalea sp.]|nr:phosphatidylglycerophosphatase A [Hydrotalea sp.]
MKRAKQKNSKLKLANAKMNKGAKWLVAWVVATGGGLGYAPIASGTVVSFAVALLFFGLTIINLLSHELFFIWLLWLFIIIPLGFWATEHFLKNRKLIDKNNPKRNDPSEVVVDEIIGQTIALLPIAFCFSFLTPMVTSGLIVVSFFLFRLFDIWKPSIIGRVDMENKLAASPKGIMVIMDDVYAGIASAIILLLVIILGFGRWS